MTNSKTRVDDYVRQVESHLKLRGRARRQALNDLRDALREAAEAVDDAIAVAGRAQDYAACLDEQFGTSDGRFRTILGAPNSLGRGIGRRMAGTFNPADERLLVPRVFGIGWTPCIGPVLGAILGVAAARETVGDGAILLAVYSLGLAVPFWIAAGFSGAFMRFLVRFRRHLGTVEKIMGVLLILTGLAFIFGYISAVAIWFQQTFPILSQIG